MTALPEILVLVFVDMGEEYIRVALGVCSLPFDGESVVCRFLYAVVLHGVETVTSVPSRISPRWLSTIE